MKLLLMTFFLGLLSAAFVVQSSKEQDVFHAVPADKQQQLKEAVLKQVEYQKKRKWKEIYAVYDNERNISYQQFLNERSHEIELLDFTPLSVAYVPPSNRWVIDGCAHFNWKSLSFVDGTIRARETPTGWRLSTVAIAPRHDGSTWCTDPKVK